jgi:amino acid transporter
MHSFLLFAGKIVSTGNIYLCVYSFRLSNAVYSFYRLKFQQIYENEYNVGMLAAYTAYTSQCIGMINFRTKLGKLKRKFKSPFGILGVIFAGILFSCGIISIIGFQKDYGFSIVSFCILIALFSVYYYFVKDSQTLSPEEGKLI